MHRGAALPECVIANAVPVLGARGLPSADFREEFDLLQGLVRAHGEINSSRNSTFACHGQRRVGLAVTCDQAVSPPLFYLIHHPVSRLDEFGCGIYIRGKSCSAEAGGNTRLIRRPRYREGVSFDQGADAFTHRPERLMIAIRQNDGKLFAPVTGCHSVQSPAGRSCRGVGYPSG